MARRKNAISYRERQVRVCDCPVCNEKTEVRRVLHIAKTKSFKWRCKKCDTILDNPIKVWTEMKRM